MNESTRIAWWQDLCRRHPEIQQFGQPSSSRFFGGATACAATDLQLLALGWTGRKYTLDQIAVMAGYPDARQREERLGMYASQVERFIKAAGLPYRIVFDWGYFDVLRRANTYGPVGVGVCYGFQPEWEGFVYRGRTADGRPNGIASPRGAAGKTQLSGFEKGPHLDLVLGYHVRRNRARAVIGRTVHVKDPNHGSAARPERPAFDDMTEGQFKALYESYRSVLGRRLYAVVPTEVFSR